MIFPQVGRHWPSQDVYRVAGQSTILWVTICSKDRYDWMAQESVFELFQETALQPEHAWLVGEFLLMPDHMHFFAAMLDPEIAFERWVAYFKHQFTKKHRKEKWCFQRKSFHHRMRSHDQYCNKLDYMRQNPCRRKLIERAEDWPWKGKIHDLAWVGR
jgi:putative transposase